jgi:hypothetical protein
MKLIKEFKNFNPHPENKFPQLDGVESNNDELSRKEMEEPLNVVSGFEEDELEDMSDDELEDMYAALEKDVELRNEGFIKSFENFEYKEESLNESKNKPTNSKLWSRCKSWAKSKYDVWPSAYACGAAAKRYKSKGGKCKKKSKKK